MFLGVLSFSIHICRLKFSYTNKFHENSFAIRTLLFNKIRNIIYELSFNQKSLIIYFPKKNLFLFLYSKSSVLMHILNFLYYFFLLVYRTKSKHWKKAKSFKWNHIKLPQFIWHRRTNTTIYYWHKTKENLTRYLQHISRKKNIWNDVHINL